jgi:murein DD-endopeptidase MepM/ murein hydrolase activator NlpD
MIRRRRHLLLLVPLVLLLMSDIAPADAASSSSTSTDALSKARQQREAARAAQANAAAQINLLNAADADVAAALGQIEQSVAYQQGQVDEARQRLEVAERDATSQQARVGEAEAGMVQAKNAVGDLAVQQYIGRATESGASFYSATISQTLRRGALAEFATGVQTDAVEQLRGFEADQRDALAQAQLAVSTATRLRADLAAELEVLQTRQVDQQRVRNEVKKRLVDWERQQDALASDEQRLTDVIQKEQAKLVGSATASKTSLQGFQWPAKGPTGSGFGLRVHPIFKVAKPHNGLDITAGMGVPVSASKAGAVIFAGVMTGFGNVVMIQHEGPVTTVYAHLSKIVVRVNEKVDRGEVIGAVGATGWATGPHLHFEVRVNGVPRDPMLFLP